MALSKSLLFGLVLIAVIVHIESRTCNDDLSIFTRKCDEHCCGILPPYECRSDCDGILCSEDSDCGDGCCRDDECGNCPLSVAIIASISAGGVVFLIIIVAISVCCCGCCRSQPRTVVVGQWGHLHNPAAQPSVNVVHTSSNVHMQH